MQLGISLGLDRRGVRRGGASLVALEALPTFRGVTLEAAPVVGSVRGWVNDPPYADRVGAIRTFGNDRAFADLFAFSRASRATDLDAYGGLNDHPVNALRQGYAADNSPAGWEIEGAGQNNIGTARAESGTAGSPGTLPTGWFITGALNGLVRTLTPAVNDNNVPGILVRLSGTASAPGSYAIFQPAITTISPSTIYTHSLYTRLVAGSLANVTGFVMRMDETQADGTYIANRGQVSFTPTATLQRVTSTSTSAANAGRQIPLFSLAYAAGEIDLTLFVGGLQHEAARFATSLMLPPAGTPGVSTQSPDLLRIEGARFAEIFGSGAPAGYLIMDVQLDGAADQGQRFLAQLDGGSDTSRLQFRTSANGLSFLVTQSPDGTVAGNNAAIHPVTYGAPVRVGIRWGAGAMSICTGGGAVSTIAASLPNETTLRLGHAIAGNHLFGRVRGVWAGGYAPTDARFQAACVLGADVAAALGA